MRNILRILGVKIGIFLALLLMCNLAHATQGDVNGDGLVGLEEAIYALQIISGAVVQGPIHCDGNPRGGFILDACGVCGGDGSSCILDCNSDEGGTAYIDSCGFCVGGNTGNTSEVTCITSVGQIWMDRNLGASQVATSSSDAAAYGDLYQWGRLLMGTRVARVQQQLL